MGATRRQRRKAGALLLVAVLAAGAGVLAYATNVLRRPELQSIDARFSIRGTQRPPSNIVFVEISAQAEHELAERRLKFRSPLPRKYDAGVVDNLRRGGARAIVMDLEFTQETEPREDLELFEAVGRAHGKVVLVTVYPQPDGGTQIFGGNENLRKIGARPAEARLDLDPDGVVRRMEREWSHLASVPVVATEVMTGHEVPTSLIPRGGSVPIDFAGPPGTIHAISYARVLSGQFPKGLFRGKLVIVGASAPILQDLHATATSGERPMPGPEVWANGVATLLAGVPLRDVPGWVDVLLIVVLGAAVPLGSLRVRRWRSLLDAFALAAVYTVGVQVAFDNGRILSYVYPMLALAAGTLGTLSVLYVRETLERERVRSVFSRFVPADVVEQVLASTNENLRLGGVERDCTVLFSDLRGFTSFSESQPAARVIEVVNCYLNEMTEAILAAGGTLIAYMGDGIMAVFGAPLEQEDHADRAVAAAAEMVGSRLQRFNTWMAGQGFEREFEMGVGLHSGTVMAGNVGSEQRVEYTAIGDTTNTASRLEGMTKDSSAMVFISGATRERMSDRGVDLCFVGDVSVRGRAAKLAVWTLPAGMPGSLLDQPTQDPAPPPTAAQEPTAVGDPVRATER